MNDRRVPEAGAQRLGGAVAILLLAVLLLGLFPSLALGAWTPPPTVTANAAGTGSISGRVTDSHGVGLPDVQVDVVVLTPSLETIADAMTDTSGSYVVTGLPNVTVYVATLNRDGYVDEWYDGVSALGNYDGTGATRIDLAATPAWSNIDFALDRGRTISGKVTDSSGKGIAGLPMTAVTKDGTAGVGGVYTGDDGTYTLEGLAPGRYLVYAQNAEGLVDEWYKNVIYAGNPDGKGATPVDVTSASATGIDFSLEVGKSISGHVYVGKSPATEGLVNAYSVSGDFVQAVNIDQATGEYRISGLPTGSYRIRTEETGAVDAWYQGDPVSVDGLGDSSPAISVGSADVTGKDFVLDTSATETAPEESTLATAAFTDTTLAPAPTSHSTEWSILGITVGVLVVLVIGAAAVLLLRRRRKG